MLIRLENVNKFYVNNNVTSLGLINVNLELNKNEIVAIVGESGSGKSTLLNVITKVDKFDEGEIYYYGNETSHFNIHEMDEFRKNKVGFIFQNYNILDSYTVLDNVMLPLLINGMNKKEAKEKAIELITKVGLKDRLKSRGTQLSGGEKQRCVIARALAMSSEILACDEPTGNLDSETSKEIIDLIKEVAKDKLVLIVTHNYDLVKDIATRKIRVHDGQIVEDSIIVKTEEKEEKQAEIEFESTDVKRRVDAKIALKNILSTPKRTLLTSLIFFAICFFFIFMTCYVNVSIAVKPGDSNPFYYRGDNKLIVYDPLNTIDENKIKSISNEYEINETYYNSYVQMLTYFIENNPPYQFYQNYAYEAHPNNLKIVGNYPTNDGEIIMLYDSKPNQLIDRVECGGRTFKVTGYQVRKDLGFGRVITGNPLLQAYFNIYNIISQQHDIYFGETTKLIGTQDIIRSISDRHKFINLDDIPFEYEENYNFSPDFIIGKDIKDYYSTEVYEAAVYGNVNLMKYKINQLGLQCLSVKTYSTEDSFQIFLNKLLAYLVIIMASLYLIGIYFLTYVIVGRIYDSRIKDFTIFRTVGIKAKDMKRITRYDIMSQMLFCETACLITFYILGKNIDNGFFNIFKGMDIFIIILYLILMNLIGILLGNKIHKRIYSKTINQVLGGTKND